MAYLSEQFDASQVEPQMEFKPIPPGWYKAVIVNSELKDTNNRTGVYLQLEFRIISENQETNNRLLFVRLNLENQNETAVRIARAELSSICHATGVMKMMDSEQLHGIPMDIKVVIKPPRGGYDASNEVKGFRSVGGSSCLLYTSPSPRD